MKYSTLLTLILFVNFGFSQKMKETYTGYVFELINNDSLSPLTGVNVYYLVLMMELQQFGWIFQYSKKIK